MFIKVTNKEDGKALAVNLAFIVGILEDDDGCKLLLENGNWFSVVEPMSMVSRMLVVH